jgi:hypothetical protein
MLSYSNRNTKTDRLRTSRICGNFDTAAVDWPLTATRTSPRRETPLVARQKPYKYVMFHEKQGRVLPASGALQGPRARVIHNDVLSRVVHLRQPPSRQNTLKPQQHQRKVTGTGQTRTLNSTLATSALATVTVRSPGQGTYTSGTVLGRSIFLLVIFPPTPANNGGNHRKNTRNRANTA